MSGVSFNGDNIGEVTGVVFDVREFTLHDGGGIRTTVFLKGCPLRCVWCHNPEGQSFEPELIQKPGCVGCGKCRLQCAHDGCRTFGRCVRVCPNGLLSVAGYNTSAELLLKRLMGSADIMKFSGGGVTFSGGEPMCQHKFVIAVAELLRQNGIGCVMETCGYCAPADFSEVLRRLDFVYYDIKIADNAAHLKYTGVENTLILNNLSVLRKSGLPFVIRTPLIPGITDTDENIAAIKAICENDTVEFLPYNNLAGAKYSMLGREYPLDN